MHPDQQRHSVYMCCCAHNVPTRCCRRRCSLPFSEAASLAATLSCCYVAFDVRGLADLACMFQLPPSCPMSFSICKRNLACSSHLLFLPCLIATLERACREQRLLLFRPAHTFSPSAYIHAFVFGPSSVPPQQAKWASARRQRWSLFFCAVRTLLLGRGICIGCIIASKGSKLPARLA